MSESGLPTVQQFVRGLLAVSGHRERMRMLRDHADRFDAELVEELRRSAERELRRDPREAGRRAQLGFAVADSLNDDRARIACLIERTKAAVHCSNPPLALMSVDQAARHAKDLGDEALEAQLELLRLHPLIALERYSEARSGGERVLAVFERRGDDKGRLLARMALADLAYRADRPREALRHYADAERLLAADAPPQARGVLAMNRANSLDACNRFRAAARHFERARGFFRQSGSEHSAAQNDYNAAYCDLLRGRYEDALRRYAICEDAFRRLGDDRHLAHIDLDRAEIHLHLNLAEDATAFASAAEDRFRELGLAKEHAQAADLGARAAELAGDAAGASSRYARAERLFAALGLGERAFACVVARAGLAERAGDSPAARTLAATARAMLGADANPLSVATVDLLVARLDLVAGAHAAALAAAEAVFEACRRIHAPWVHIEALRVAGRAHFELGATERAIEAYRRAIEALERFRGGVPPDEYMSSFLAGRAALYEEIVDVLVSAGDSTVAFGYAERAKSRALVDLLAGRHDRGALEHAATPSARRVRYLRERLNAVYQQLLRREGDGDVRSSRFLAETRDRAREIEHEIATLFRRRRVEDRAAASLDAVDAPDVADVRASLGPGEALVEYLLTPRGLYVFAVTHDEVHVVRRDATAAEVSEKLRRFRFHLARGERARPEQAELGLRAARANLAALTAWLLEPLAPQLAGKRRLVIVPHGELHQLPFHALPWGDGWLCDTFEVVYAPSAAVYGFCRAARPSAEGEVAVFGLPDERAPRIEDECRRVAQVHGSSKLHLRDEATFGRLAEEATRARILHIATHGMFRHEHPMLSCVRMADRWVNLYDLYGLKVRGELVVLSTCESGVANANGANEIVGLTRGFLYAGAPALLTSQWPVDDAVTWRFMERFHEALRDGDDAAAAQRRAMAYVRDRHPHPYHWAPFFLTGCPADARRPAPSGHAAEAASSHPGNHVECPLAATA